MHHLIDSFYRSITDGTPVPIPYREILLTARIMDAIFNQLNAHESRTHDDFHDHGSSVVQAISGVRQD